MTGAVIANFPIIALIVLGIVGVPLWMTFKRPHQHPDYAEARAYFRAKDAAEPHVSEFVPSSPGGRGGRADRGPAAPGPVPRRAWPPARDRAGRADAHPDRAAGRGQRDPVTPNVGGSARGSSSTIEAAGT